MPKRDLSCKGRDCKIDPRSSKKVFNNNANLPLNRGDSSEPEERNSGVRIFGLPPTTKNKHSCYGNECLPPSIYDITDRLKRHSYSTASIDSFIAEDEKEPEGVIRSYKAGIRPFDWLIQPITDLMRVRQVLKYSERHRDSKGNFIGNFEEFKNGNKRKDKFREDGCLRGCKNEDLIFAYEKLFKEYSTLYISDLVGVIKENENQIEALKRSKKNPFKFVSDNSDKDYYYNILENQITGIDLITGRSIKTEINIERAKGSTYQDIQRKLKVSPNTIRDAVLKNVPPISLRDYQYAAAESIRFYNKHFNNQAKVYMDFIDKEYKEENITIEIGKNEKEEEEKKLVTVKELIQGNYIINRSRINKITEKFCEMEDKNRNPEEDCEMAKVLGKNIHITAQKIILPALNGYKDTLKKFKKFVETSIAQPDSDLQQKLRSSIATYITCGQVGSFMCKIFSYKLAKKGAQLNPTWVRDTLVGWRRKFDKVLNEIPEIKIEELPWIYHELADDIKNIYSHNIRREDIDNFSILISILERNKVLHLLPLTDIDLTCILTEDEVRDNVISLYQAIRKDLGQAVIDIVEGFIRRHSMKDNNKFTLITESVFSEASDLLVKEVEANLEYLRKNNLMYQKDGIKETAVYCNTNTFLNKSKFLKSKIGGILRNKESLSYAFKYYLAGAQFTRSLGIILEAEAKISKEKFRNLVTALRGIVSNAYAILYNYFGENSVAEKLKEENFDPSRIASFPFLSFKRTRSEIPFSSNSNGPLYFSVSNPLSGDFEQSKRPSGRYLSFKEISDFVRDGREIAVEVPLVRPSIVQDNGIMVDIRIAKSLPFHLMLSDKALNAIKEGANIVSCKVLVPKPPSNKIVISVTLNAKSRVVFKHGQKYVSLLDRDLIDKGEISLPKMDYIGSDFNELGKYMIALGTPDYEIDLTPITEYLGIEKAKNKLDKYKEIKAKIQQDRHNLFLEIYKRNHHCFEPAIREAAQILERENKKINDNNIEQKVANTPHLLSQCVQGLDSLKIKNFTIKQNLLEVKQSNIFRDALIKICMIYSYAAKKTSVTYFAWDDISEMSTKGLTGRLASAVTYLPRIDGLKGLFKEMLEDFGLNFNNIYETDARTSSICAECGSRTDSLKEDYHTVRCDNGHEKNRHENAARVSAQSLEKRVLKENKDNYFHQFLLSTYR